MAKQNFVILEQAEDGECYISYMRSKSIKNVLDDYQTIECGNFIVLTEDAFNRLKLVKPRD